MEKEPTNVTTISIKKEISEFDHFLKLEDSHESNTDNKSHIAIKQQPGQGSYECSICKVNFIICIK